MRGRNRERAFVFAPVLGADTLQVADLVQRSAGCRDERFSGGCQGGEPLPLPNEDSHTELVLELPDLLADAGL